MLYLFLQVVQIFLVDIDHIIVARIGKSETHLLLYPLGSTGAILGCCLRESDSFLGGLLG